MEELTQTISNLVGILLGIVGVVGVGFFIYGAYLYLTASGAPNQMERGKSAMMTALAGIVLAMVAYGVVELVMNAVVGSPVGPHHTRPHACAHPGRRIDRGEREGETHERTRGTDPRAGRGQGSAVVHLPADRGADGGVRPVLRRIPLRPRGTVRGEDGDCRPPRPGGIAAVVGKIGGRRLPLVAADLLKYRLGARLYAGPPSELVRSEPPAPVQPVKPAKSGPGPLRLMAKKASKTLRSLRPKRRSREKAGGRMPFRPHRWFGKPRRAEEDKERHERARSKDRQRKKPRGFLAVVAAVALAAAVSTVPQTALADDHEPWRDEIDFEVTEPVEGRRIFVERLLTVSGDRAAVTLRAATGVDIRIRAFGGPDGHVAALLGFGQPGSTRGELSRLQVPPARTRAVLHLLVGGHPGPGRGAHRRAATVSRTRSPRSKASSATCA